MFEWIYFLFGKKEFFLFLYFLLIYLGMIIFFEGELLLNLMKLHDQMFHDHHILQLKYFLMSGNMVYEKVVLVYFFYVIIWYSFDILNLFELFLYFHICCLLNLYVDLIYLYILWFCEEHFLFLLIGIIIMGNKFFLQIYYQCIHLSCLFYLLIL
jgi:hypothetical protein